MASSKDVILCQEAVDVLRESQASAKRQPDLAANGKQKSHGLP
jgi:hypothetical protein